MSKIVTIGSATLYLADCRDVLPSLVQVDSVITDPPYGVQLKGKRGHYRNSPNFDRGITYSSYEDTPQQFDEVVLPVIDDCRSLASACLIFMSDQSIFKMPQGRLGGIFMANGCGIGSWGFQCFMHCVFYGKDPYLANRMGSRPNGKLGIWGNDSNKIDHPCPKPIAAMEWAVTRASLPGYLVLDPFMGSGTTGVACARLGRRFIGIEIEEKYFDIAVQRVTQAHEQA
jgi:site-specific DNA-methyltransferase (adenine-specific)